MEYELRVQEVSVWVRLKNIKNLHLSVHPPHGAVTVSAPLDTDKEKIKVYLLTKLNWIRRQQEKISKQRRENSYRYISRESHYFFGERYLLKVNEQDIMQKEASVKKKPKSIELNIPVNSTLAFKEELLHSYCRTELKTFLKELVVYWSKKMEVSIPSFGIRTMKTKWGSCNTVKRSLLFNSELTKKPKPCIEYVVVHEMVHLLVRHHNQDFILLMDRYLPDWRLRKRELNELPVG